MSASKNTIIRIYQNTQRPTTIKKKAQPGKNIFKIVSKCQGDCYNQAQKYMGIGRI